MATKEYFVGLDVGSSTVKIVVLDRAGDTLFSRYERHFSLVRRTLSLLVRQARQALPGGCWAFMLTGSGAMGLAKQWGLPFVQEVLACGACIRQRIPHCDVAIELGGEDAKLTFLTNGPEQRMNETCAGGTGAFIDHMAAMLHTDPQGLDQLARNHTMLYPIASRCGVFAKADILPLLNEGCAREDIAASIFQAVVEQTITGLACGRKIRGRVAFLGGPLAFLPALRQRFVDALVLDDGTGQNADMAQGQAIFPPHAELFVATGAALLAMRNFAPQSPGMAPGAEQMQDAAAEGQRIATLLEELEQMPEVSQKENLAPLFADAADRADFEARHHRQLVPRRPLEELRGAAYLGLDMGSTTTKAVCMDAEGRILYTHYGSNKGEPLQMALQVLRQLYARLPEGGHIAAAGVTGYGSALVRAALGVDVEEVETVAHLTAARFLLPEVSYVLDIGGQDIKCMHIDRGHIRKIQLNEACSSGCGSFVETFASSLNMDLKEFVRKALAAASPIDLGTRCTVFMNSRVKQAQKEGADVGDIAAGLSYSVIRNALYKVIKIKDVEELGLHVMAQGGAFHNDALLRALELCLGRPVMRPDIAGLMGAYGVALLARSHKSEQIGQRSSLISAEGLKTFTVQNSVTRCQACSNHCRLTVSRFWHSDADADMGADAFPVSLDSAAEGSAKNGPESGRAQGRHSRFISGNRCERGLGQSRGSDALPNLVAWKYHKLFEENQPLPHASATRGVVGLPRALSIYENYTLWFTLFSRLGFRVELSSHSTRELFAAGGSTIPSQTLCYPAKLAHGHVADLAKKNVNAIFFPCIPLENKQFAEQDHQYNCPVVGGYPEVIHYNMDCLKEKNIAFYSPFLPLDQSRLADRLVALPLFAGIGRREIKRAVNAAFEAQEAFQAALRAKGEAVLRLLEARNGFGIVLAAHPYHIDPEVHHGIPDYIQSLGMAVLTEDSIAHLASPPLLRVVNQWTYHARLYRAAALVAHNSSLALVHLVSFGCGLSALTAEQMEEILVQEGRPYTQIKIDEGQNTGPARIRIRSLLASLRQRSKEVPISRSAPAGAVFTPEMRHTHTILVGMVAPFHSFLMERACRACGYKTAFLPHVDVRAVDEGLRLVNNDACYPAIVTVGQIMQALQSGTLDTDKVALLVYQTGGGCRATNYMALLRKALADCKLHHVPLISFNLQGRDSSPGFRIDWALLKRCFMGCCLADLLSRLVCRVEPYEVEAGAARALSTVWLERSAAALTDGNRAAYAQCMRDMVRDFEALPLRDVPRRPRVAIVGEILVKYHEFANNELAKVIVAEGGEVVLPDILDFFLYCLYDDVFRHQQLAGSWLLAAKSQVFRRVVEWYRAPMLHALKGSQRFESPTSFEQLLALGRQWISLGQQAGEGWLLTAEMIKYLSSGVQNIICVQPFGCLPNHVTGKGMFREIKRRCPGANLVAIDYDQATSETNQINRIKLMMDAARRAEYGSLTEPEVLA